MGLMRICFIVTPVRNKVGRFFFLFFYLFLCLFQKPKHLFKENRQSKLLKVIVKFASRQNLPSKDSLIKMPLHAKLSLFVYVISSLRSKEKRVVRCFQVKMHSTLDKNTYR